jgi:hypothetical protein
MGNAEVFYVSRAPFVAVDLHSDNVGQLRDDGELDVLQAES